MRQFREAEALTAARLILHAQGIIAVKGLGGYHLVADARSTNTILRLRTGKQRPHKPFAIMFRDLAALRSELSVSPLAAGMLTSLTKPIVILGRRATSTLPDTLAPGLDTLGAMLPYTPLYAALFDELLDVLIVTSANNSGEPMVFQDDLAQAKLAQIADGILTHDHRIPYPVDDSVLYYVDAVKLDQPKAKPSGYFSGSPSIPCMVPRNGESEKSRSLKIAAQARPILIRRGRGYVPAPLSLNEPVGQTILGCGSDIKACFCVGKGLLAYPSPYLGNLENPATLDRYRYMLSYYRETFDLDPVVVAYDLNPALISSRIIALQGFEHLIQVPIQHHHAHIAACMGENRIHRPVIGIAYDGSGYGLDGRVWGGEILLASSTDCHRLAHWQNVPLPGNDLAIRYPWRMTFSYLKAAGLEEPCRLFLASLPEGYREIATRLLGLWEAAQASWLETSSMGRLFDGIAAYLGLCLQTTYTGQPAILLENAAWRGVRKVGLSHVLPYGVDELISSVSHNSSIYRSSNTFAGQLGADGSLCTDNLPKSIALDPLLQCITKDKAGGMDTTLIAARFHRTIAQVTAVATQELCQQLNIDTIALSGGVWQNQLLCHWTITLLKQMGLDIIRHEQLSPSDESLGFGQVIIAGARLAASKGEKHPCASPYRPE
ncbi:MAG: carbamoyltransferase HypF [Firmicutes bacterium]|nr:carbamoyltransferase HypF [Bacillota bacterium]